MEFLILGDGPEERRWGAAIEALASSHRLAGIFPAWPDRPDWKPRADLDDALALAGIEAVIVGGEPGFREEALRRVAGMGLAAIVLHPPGLNADPYYHVALSREETGAIVVPDAPFRLHPAIDDLQAAWYGRGVGSPCSMRLEVTTRETDLVRQAFPRYVDGIRAILGDIEALTATGDPPGQPFPTISLNVQLRGPGSRTAEVRIVHGARPSGTLTVVGPDGSMTLEFDPDWVGPSRLVWTEGDVTETRDYLDFDPRREILETLATLRSGKPAWPDLLDGTRAVEVAEGAARSLRRGRTIELHYEEVSESGNFKSIMTSLGCSVLLSILVIVPLALAGPAFGAPWLIYIAYVIPPALGVFLLLQFLRLGLKSRPGTLPERDAGAG